jgi:heme exporter protein A
VSAPVDGPPPPRQALIEVAGVVKMFGLLPALRGVTLAVPRGQFMALLGPNGSGKSTLLRLLASLSRPNQGVIRVGGWELPREAAAVRAQIGLVAHKPLLYDSLTARENLLFFARLYDLPSDQRAARVDQLLAQVGLNRRAHDLARTFSRGMQQRLSIARALLHDPAVLLLDEPYTGLDPKAAATLDALLRSASESGRTIVMSTHDLDRAAALTDRALILARGQIVHDAPIAGLDGTRLNALYTDLTQ